MADLIERADAINAIRHVTDSPNYSKSLGELLHIPSVEQTEPQKKEVEWVYNKRERLWYPYSNGELLFKDKPTTQTETQNSNLTFEKRTMLDCYNCKRYKSDDACVECRYEPTADTPQTDWHYDEQDATWYPYKHEDEPQQKSCATCKHALGNWDGESNNCGRCCGADRRFYEPKTESQTERKE